MFFLKFKVRPDVSTLGPFYFRGTFRGTYAKLFHPETVIRGTSEVSRGTRRVRLNTTERSEGVVKERERSGPKKKYILFVEKYFWRCEEKTQIPPPTARRFYLSPLQHITAISSHSTTISHFLPQISISSLYKPLIAI